MAPRPIESLLTGENEKIGTLTIIDRDANSDDLIDDPGAPGVATYSYDPASPQGLRRAGPASPRGLRRADPASPRVLRGAGPASPRVLRGAGGQNRRIRKVVAATPGNITYDYYYNESHGLRNWRSRLAGS